MNDDKICKLLVKYAVRAILKDPPTDFAGLEWIPLTGGA